MNEPLAMRGAAQYMSMLAVLGACGVSMALMIAGDIWIEPHSNLRGPVLAVRLVGAVVVALPTTALPWLVLAWAALRKSPRHHGLSAMGMVWMMSAPGAFFAMDAANVLLADPHPRVHEVRFIKRVRARKSNYSTVSSWRAPGETLSFTAPLPLSGSVRPGDRLEVTVWQGGLGYEYVTSVRPVPVATRSPGV